LSVSSGTINVTGNITSGGTVAQTRLTFSGTGVLNIGGNLGAIGTLAPSTGTVNFNGSGVQTVAASLPFNNLMVSSGATLIFPATNTPTVSGTMTNNGTVQQTRNVSNATVSFLTISTDKYRGVDITTTANLGSVTVRIRRVATQTCTTTGGTSPTYALRCYEITPTTSGAATVTLWALDSQRNGIPVANLVPYRYTGSTWTKLTGMVNGTGSNGYVFGRGNTTGFSAFLLGDTNLAPTAVSLNHISATAPSSWLLLSFVGFMLVLTGWQWHHRRQN
jgi:hypothetical protein